MDLKLTGRRALVSGATKGIGRAIAECLAAEGALVSICARDQAEVDATVATLGGAFGRALDVADGEALAAWVEASAKALGGIDIVVPNVSAMSTEDSWPRNYETDLMGTVNMVEAALPLLRRSDAASIVIISSVSGREIGFAPASYGASKAALVHYAQHLAYHLAGKGIRANTVSPGNIHFPGGIWARVERDRPEIFAQALARNPTGRMGQTDEVARAVAFLASPAASFISGTNLVVDGALSRGVQL